MTSSTWPTPRCLAQRTRTATRRAFAAGWRRTPPRPPPTPRDPFLHAAATNKQVEALRGDGHRRRRFASAGRRMHPCALPVCENESTRLDIKQASDGTQDVPGLLEPQVGSIDDVWEILTNGGRNRSVGSTNANELSSFSHWFGLIIALIVI
ncbi:uncharacterized protein LOC121990868 [Zingiber officinale]|uniref:uncharacterized protein LOC121990868 n=1 Tax=Zingiber officinale TaxID=94328 RepID=UPI001C4D8579|nr:uncharacterized protein LOC121990868 [Zingiber officinale]